MIHQTVDFVLAVVTTNIGDVSESICMASRRKKGRRSALEFYC